MAQSAKTVVEFGQSKKGRPRPTAERTHQLTKFGHFVEALRLAKKLTQAGLSALLKDEGDKDVTQSYLTRLERGLVGDPSEALLKSLSKNLDVGYEVIVAALVSDKYRVDKERLLLLTKESMTLPSLADWERKHKEIWVVARHYVDRYQDQFRKAVETVLQQDGGKVVFFIPQGLAYEFAPFRTHVLTNVGKGPEDEALSACVLTQEEASVMTASFVLADPLQTAADGCSGFLILNDDEGIPHVALCMSEKETKEKAMSLNAIRLKPGRLNPKSSV